MGRNLVTFELDELVDLLDGFRLGHRIEPDNTIIIYSERTRLDVAEEPILMGHVDLQPWETTMDEIGEFIDKANKEAYETKDVAIFCKNILGCNTPKDVILLDNKYHDLFLTKDPVDVVPFILKDTTLTAVQKVYGLITLGEHVTIEHIHKPMTELLDGLNPMRLIPISHQLMVDSIKGDNFTVSMKEELDVIEQLMKENGVDMDPHLKMKVEQARIALDALKKMKEGEKKKDKESKEVLYR